MTDTKPTLGLARFSSSTVFARLLPFRRIVAGVLGAAFLVAAGGFASAQEEERKDEWIDQKFIRNVFGGLGVWDDSPTINYHERSPLVIPPGTAGTNLPPPESAASARQNPAWPKDPDRVKKTAKRQEAVTQGYWDDEAKPLRPDQLNRRGGTVSTTSDGKTVEESARPMKPSELGYKGGIFSSLFGYKEETATFTGEPPRESLIEPPSGYRTPSAAQPYGILGKEAPKVLDLKDRGLANSSK